jgi:hypothetical protein
MSEHSNMVSAAILFEDSTQIHCGRTRMNVTKMVSAGGRLR